MRLFPLVCLLALGCSTAVTDDSTPTDSGKPDQSVADSGKMDSGKDGSMNMDSGMDSSTDDGGMDGSMADASDGSSQDGGMMGDGGFDPSMLSGLALWLDAAKGVTKNNNQVSKWADQSGNANDASQGTSSLQPTWSSSVINSLPALHFTQGNQQYMTVADASSLQWGTGDFLVEVVGRFDNDPNNSEYGIFYAKVGQSSGIFFLANDAQNQAAGLTAAIDANNMIATTQKYNDNTGRSYGFRRTGSTLELRANGQQVATQSQQGSVDVGASGQDVFIGDYNNQLPLDGDIAEIVAVKGSTSMQDLSALEAYFKAKYNL